MTDTPLLDHALRTSLPASLRGGLRYYQHEGIDACQAELEAGRSTALVLATGLGKTSCACTVAYEWTEGRVLFIAHREELLDQIGSRLRAMSGGALKTGTDIGYEQAGSQSMARNKFVLASNASAWRAERLDRLEREGGFGLIIIDEFHRAGAASKTYMEILKRFPNAPVLGLSATPYRTDKRTLDHVAADAAYRMDVGEGIEAGFLVPIEAELITILDVDLDLVPARGGDLAPGALDTEMLKGIMGIVHELVKRVPWNSKQGIVFVPGVQCAHFMVDVMRNLSGDKDIAICVDGKTPKDARKRMLDGFRAGKHQWFVNVDVATEGFDAPSTEVVVMASPTKSKLKHVQRMGRGTRVEPGLVDHLPHAHQAAERRTLIAASGKPHLTVYDFVANCTKHTLVCPADILGEAMGADEETVKRAKAKLANGKAQDVQAALRDALQERLAEEEREAQKRQDELARAQERAAVAASAVVNGVTALSRKVDPRALASPLAKRKKGRAPGRGPVFDSQSDVDMLKRYGFSDSQVKEYGVSVLLAARKRRQAAGLATLKQVRQLKRFGITDSNISSARAGQAMAYLAECDWDFASVSEAKLRTILYHEEAHEVRGQ